MTELRKFYEYAKNNPKEDGSLWTIAILSFYRRQESMLRKHIQLFTESNTRKDFRYPKGSPKIKIELRTVDSVQGHESDLVFISLANNRHTTFLDNPNRINVAVTRARYQCVIVGNKRVMKKARSTLKDLAMHTRDHIMVK